MEGLYALHIINFKISIQKLKLKFMFLSKVMIKNKKIKIKN